MEIRIENNQEGGWWEMNKEKFDKLGGWEWKWEIFFWIKNIL